jgi:hypothetical protein
MDSSLPISLADREKLNAQIQARRKIKAETNKYL